MSSSRPSSPDLWRVLMFFFFSSRRRHTRWTGDWSSDVCSSDLAVPALPANRPAPVSRIDRVPVLAWLVGGVFVAVELAVSGRYGFQQDELYFIVRSEERRVGKECRSRWAACD